MRGLLLLVILSSTLVLQVGSFVLAPRQVSQVKNKGISPSALYGSRNKAKKKHRRQQEESKSVFEQDENGAGMDQMHVRIVEEQADVEVSFFMPDGQLSVMIRAKSEPVCQTIRRMEKSLEKRLLSKSAAKSRSRGVGMGSKGGNKGKGSKHVAQPCMSLIAIEVVDGDTQTKVPLQQCTNEDGWKTGYQVRVLYCKKKKPPRQGQCSSSTSDEQHYTDTPHTTPTPPQSVAQEEGEGCEEEEEDPLALLYHVIVNPPAIKELKFYARQSLMSGYPILPLVEHEFTHSVSYKYMLQDTRTHPHGPWRVVGGEGPLYTPCVEDEGHKLKVLATPITQQGLRGRTITCYASGVISKGPTPQMESVRLSCGQRQLERTEAPVTRVVCYNILADMYATSDYSLKHLYDYLDPCYLSSDYRSQLTLRELQAYNADIICLQEVDQRVFENLLCPHLSLQGFEGRFKAKCGTTPEGCATFVRRDRYQILQDLSFNLKDAMQHPHNTFKGLMAAHPNLAEIAQHKLTTIAQVLLLQTTHPQKPDETAEATSEKGRGGGGGDVLLANSHLFFHPHASHVRVMQAHTITKALHHKQQALEKEQHGHKKPVIVLCGDLNSNPRSGAIRFLTGEPIEPTDTVWERITTFNWGNKRISEEGEGEEEGGEGATGGGEGEGEEAGGGVTIKVQVEERDLDAEEDLTCQDPSAKSKSEHAVETVLVTVTEDGHLGDPPSPRLKHTPPQASALSSGVPVSPLNSPSPLPTLLNPTPFLSTTGFPDFTNFVRGFVETLDYILVEEGRVKVVDVGQMPDRQVASQDTALPSPVFPSDHVSLMADLILDLD